MALSGAIFYGFPSGKIKVIGVTGTKGKSTTVFLITKFLEEGGYRVAAIGSLGYKIGNREWPNDLKMTMPGRWKIQKFLSKALKAGCQFVVLEVTSEGIRQKRDFGIKFDAAIFTNLEKEHIESHGSFEKYYQEKQKLFKKTKNIHILNADSPYLELFSKFPAKKKIFYKLEDWQKFNLKTELIGDFNKYNILAAKAAVENYGIDHSIIQRALEKIKSIPGRMEFIDTGQQFKVVIDYAHTPESLIQVYQTLKSNQKLKIKNQKLICVFGAAGGGRDKWKRPIFGKIAAKYCDKIILTNEDPYDEDPKQILSEIKSGILNSQFPISDLEEILERKEAIKKALNLAEKGDIVIITGKGSENSMAIKDRKIPWSDKQIVIDFLKKFTF